MGRLVVQFPGDAAVIVDGAVAGRTNRTIPLSPGPHVVRLDGEATDPAESTVSLPAGAGRDEIVRVAFSSATQRVDRFSPLYCCYNGFLLGQFLSLSFMRAGRKDYAIRRARMLEFLQEVDVATDLPVEPPELGGAAHVRLLDDVLPKLAARSQRLTDFVLLGSLLTHHGLLAQSDPEMAKTSLEQLERLRDEHGLPPIDPDRFAMRPGNGDPNDVLSPSLAYLASVVERLAVEADTAFVIMPFKAPYAGYFATFYRPSLERAGYRAFRAWGGLSNEDYADLLLKLIARSGIVWADVSELNYNVLYEIGAAHALGKLSMLVANEQDAQATPANIGHDAVMRYSPAAGDFPEGTVLLMAALISTLKLAAETGERLRVTPDALATVLQETGRRLVAILTPPEARDAARQGQRLMEAGDYAGAERAFDEAIRLGLDDAPTRLGRGWSRVGLGRHPEAEADFDAVLETTAEPDAGAHKDTTARLRPIAAYFRGVAREQQNNLVGAREDYGLAIELEHGGADVFRRRAQVHLALGDVTAARRDADRARELEPDAADTSAVDGDVLSADARFEEAIAAYDRALAAERTAAVEFKRALALLLAGHPKQALEGYRRGSPLADADDRAQAIDDLERRAAALPGTPACRQALSSTSPAAGGT